MSNSFKVDVSPDMNMYRLLQSQSYSIHSALSEFVDNSIQSYIDKKNVIQITDKKENNLKINISINSRKKEIIISDNAHGINRANFQKAIKMGTDAIHRASSLSKFGVGMKTAAVWFSNTWVIETSALNSREKLICKFDLNKLLRRGETEISVSSKTERVKKHYTNIIIKRSLRMESKKYYEETLIPHLAETFVKFKNFLSLEVEYNNEKLQKKWKRQQNRAYFEPPEPLSYPVVDKSGMPKNNTKKRWKQRVDINYKGYQVKGFFMIMKTGSYSQPGVRLFRNRRVIEGTVIKPNRPQVLLGTENKYASQRLYGELHLNDFDVDFMKTKFSGDLNPLYSELKKELQKNTFIDQVNYYRSRRDAEKESVKQSLESASGQSLDRDIVTKDSKGQIRKRKVKISSNTTKISSSEEIKNKLEILENKKLFGLYNSLCTISLVEHPYLAYIGSWTFLECLSYYMGNRNNNLSFESFLHNKVNAWYVNKKQDKKTISNVITEIHKKGNEVKHSLHELSDAKQLGKDFQTLEQFIIQCIDDIQGS